MVQEGAAAPAASGPQAAGAAKKKKNKSKNKKKTASTVQATTPTGPQQSSSAVVANVSDDRSGSSSDYAKAVKLPQVATTAAEPVVNRALPVGASSQSGDLIQNLAKEFAENYAVYSHWAETKDAEELYPQQFAKHKV